MLTVLIETKNSAEPLARTLASLVSGAVEGLVRDVIVRDLGSADATVKVADHAGCTVLDGDLRSTIEAGKGDWLLLLEPGARLVDGWADVVRDHVMLGKAPARFTPARAGWVDPFRRRTLRSGLLVSKRQALAIGANDATALARRVKVRRIAAEISPAG